MSLVDYDFSSSSDDDEEEGGRNKDNIVISHPKENTTHPPNAKSTRLPVKQSESSIKRSEPSTLKLPDASLLLNSPSLPSNMSESYDHTSQVAAAMAQNASRKRDSNEPKGSYPRGKIPRGNLPHSKNVPDAARGLLRPPQLSGRGYLDGHFESDYVILNNRNDLTSCNKAGCRRSNVVTEDINKLFTRRNGPEPSSNTPSSEC